MDVVKVATELSEFIHSDQAVRKPVAKNAVQDMCRLLDAGELEQLHDLSKMLNFKQKRPLTATERTRNYRLRKQILSGKVIRSPNKRPCTAAERMRRYRERKKLAAQALNADVPHEEGLKNANGCEGVTLQRRAPASDSIENSDSSTSTPNDSILPNSTSTRPQLIAGNVDCNRKPEAISSAVTTTESDCNDGLHERLQPDKTGTQKKRPYTNAERVRRYRERRRIAAMARNSNGQNGVWVNNANGWDGIVIVPDIVSSIPLKKAPAFDSTTNNDSKCTTNSILPNLRSSKPQPIAGNVGCNGKQKACISKADNGIGNMRDITLSVNLGIEPARAIKDQPSAEPITIFLNEEPPPLIKCESLNTNDVDESDAFELCVANQWIDESESSNLNPLADVECESSKFSIEQCVAFDEAVSIANVSPKVLHSETNFETNQKTNEPRAIVESNVISSKNRIPRTSNSVFGHSGVMCDLCKRSVSNVTQLSGKRIRLSGSKFLSKNMEGCSVCQKCKTELNKNGTSSISQLSGNEDPLMLFFGNSLWQTE